MITVDLETQKTNLLVEIVEHLLAIGAGGPIDPIARTFCIGVHQAGVTAVLKDFKELSVCGDGRPYSKKLLSQDKGQKELVRAFVGAVRDGGATPIPFGEIYAVTLTTFSILESLRTRQAVDLNL